MDTLLPSVRLNVPRQERVSKADWRGVGRFQMASMRSMSLSIYNILTVGRWGLRTVGGGRIQLSERVASVDKANRMV